MSFAEILRLTAHFFFPKKHEGSLISSPANFECDEYRTYVLMALAGISGSVGYRIERFDLLKYRTFDTSKYRTSDISKFQNFDISKYHNLKISKYQNLKKSTSK